VEFGEQHDTRTNGQHYTAADRRPTNQVSAWQAEREKSPDTPILARILARKLLSCNLSLKLPTLVSAAAQGDFFDDLFSSPRRYIQNSGRHISTSGTEPVV